MSAVRLLSPEWHAIRRESVTGTDIPVLLGLSRWKSEATLAAEKLGDAEPAEETAAMRIGRAMEDIVRDEYTRETGRRLRHVRRLAQHPEHRWAVASLDFEAVGERLEVEAKTTVSRKAEDELPQDWEAQVRWQMGVAGYPAADVAALFGHELRIYRVEHDPAVFAALVDIGADFCRRLAAGGPFAHDAASVKAAYPSDDGTVLDADAELAEAVRALWALRGERKALEEREDVLETAIKTRMGPATALAMDGFSVTWKRTKDRTEVDYRGLAELLLNRVPESERAALVGPFETVREGFRPFRVSPAKGVTG